MKTLVCSLFLLISISLSAQKSLTKEDWQSDLKFLQETVHESFPFLFKKIKAKDFDARVEKLYQAIPNMEAHEIIVGFAKIISSFEYGHTYLSYQNSPVPFHKVPIKIYEFTDGVYITGTHKDHSDVVGAKVISIEGHSIKEVFKMIYPTVPAENEYFFKAYGISNVLVPEILHAQGVTKVLKDHITFTLEKDGKQFNVSIKATQEMQFPLYYEEVNPDSDWISARDQSKNPLYLKYLEKRYFFEYLPQSKTLYVRYSQVMDDPTEKIHSFFDRVFDFLDTNQVEKFVLDVRLNGGGNNFNNKKVITEIMQRPEINQKGKLFVIIGRRTFSAAQNLINELDNYTNATFVGEPSAENINFYGDNKRLRLPKSGLNVYLSWAWWQDKPQWQNDDYLRPHTFIKLSFKDYISNHDPVMEWILKE